MRLRCVFLIITLTTIPFVWNYQSRLSAKTNFYSANRGFSLLDFEEAKLRQIKDEQLYDITAILLHWKRLKSLAITVSYLIDTLFFKEIIIWNNNPNVNLTLHQLNITTHPQSNISSTPHIRIINSKDNLKDQAKYRACVEASTKACFYIDDDWNPAHYLRSLIADFRSDPYLLHSVTDVYTFYTNLVWSFFDSTIDLHSGFSWIGCGSVFLREHAHQHLQLLQLHLRQQTGLSSSIQLSDVFFSLWLNDVPSQLSTVIRSQALSGHDDTARFSAAAGFEELQHNSSVTAIRILERALRFGQHVTFPRQRRRRFPTFVKSPSYTDDLIFYTNILPVDLQTIPFNISADFERGTRRNLPVGIGVRQFSARSTSEVVDGDALTCWRPHRDLRMGDFFAIDFLRVHSNGSFLLTVDHGFLFHSHLEMSISFDGLWWIPYRSTRGIFIQNLPLPQHLQTYLVDTAQFALGFSSFRYIKYTTNNASEHRFEVCEVQLITKAKINEIRTRFRPLNR